MADIKITLSTNKKLRAPTIEAEQQWLEEEGELWYPLGPNRPRQAGQGDWIYFILAKKLVARACIEEIEPPKAAKRWTYTGVEEGSSPWLARISKMEVVPMKKRVQHIGFRASGMCEPMSWVNSRGPFADDDGEAVDTVIEQAEQVCREWGEAA